MSKLLPILALWIAGAAAHAAVIAVTTTLDAIADDGFCSLREAVLNANADSRLFPAPGECAAGSGADTIELPAGTYTLTIAPGGPGNGASGALLLKSTLSIVGTGKPVVQGGAQWTDRVFDVAGGATASLSGFTVHGGFTPVGVFSQGGGAGIRSHGALTLTNMLIEGNRAGPDGASDALGGGILVYESGSLVMTDSAVVNNTQGRASLYSYGPVTITGSAITDNTDTQGFNAGAGVFVVSTTASITNTTITNNTTQNGPGAGLKADTATVTLDNVTIAGNTAPDVVVATGTVTMRNSILGFNVFPNAATCAQESNGKIDSGGNNIVWNATGCTIVNVQPSDRLGTFDAPVDPMLASLADNGGPTQTMALLAGSPAIDGGNSATCAAKDQRGYVRPQGARCDIGAYEVAVPVAGTVVEFFNTALGHYFITANPAEQASIDAGGSGPGWTRTGNDFKSGGASSVCRFYGTPGRGPNSHFYTVDPAECAAVLGDPGWRFEAFDFSTAKPAGGQCAAGTTPVYRAYNNGFAHNDSNHRYTTNAATYNAQLALGWSGEGVVFCAPL